MNDTPPELEVSDIPLILELSLSHSNEELAEKWEVTVNKLIRFLSAYGHKLSRYRNEQRKKLVLDLYDKGITDYFELSGILEVEHGIMVQHGRVRTLLAEALNERAKSTS